MSGFDFSGVITALVTPFRQGEVDERSFLRLVQYQLSEGIEGLVVNGTTGESPTLSFDEVKRLFEIAKGEAAGSVPIILGTGSNCTKKTIEMTALAGQWGADAALVVTPYYNKPPQRGLVSHFSAVADASRIPVILYNVPGRTITAMSEETIAALARHPRIVGIKEASGDLAFGAGLIEKCGPQFLVTSGDDATCVELATLGGRGVISVVSHVIPAELKKLVQRARKGDEAARKDYQRYRELIKVIYCESNPIPVKAAMYVMGIIESPEMRLPLVSLAEEHLGPLEEILSGLGKVTG